MNSIHVCAVGAAVLLCCLRAADGEKVMFRDELTGREIWRMSNYSTFHEYCHADKPFSRDGRRIVYRQWFRSGGVVVTSPADGKETVFSKDRRDWNEQPAFVRGRNAVVYAVGREDVPIYLYDLDKGEERLVVKLKGNVQMVCAGVIGPNSEYLVLRGDLNGDGLSEWSLKPVWTDDPPRAVLTSPTLSFYPRTVSPTPECNRIGLSVLRCHPTVLERLRKGEKLNMYDIARDGRWEAWVAVLDVEKCTVKTYPAKDARMWAHEAWSGDGEYLHKSGYSWRAGADAPSVPIRIGDGQWSNHYGTCGHSGRYVAGDSGRDGMERLELTDLWTGEMFTVAYISTPTEPAGKIGQDHGHPAGSPDGTKVLIHSCYDLVNHRLYAIPTQDVHPGDAVIPVETTEGFAPSGKLLIGHGYVGKRMAITYGRTDATHFYDCDWGEDAAARLKQALKSDVIPKGSHHITDAAGRLFPDGECRPRKEYIVVVKQPDPPRAVVAARAAEGVRLKWDPPASGEEICGYVVWRRTDGGPVVRLTDAPVTSCEYLDNAPPAGTKTEYLVRAVEHSGLYGAWSSIAWVRGVQTGVDLVESYDVRGSAYITPGERPTSDRRSVRVRIPAAGEYTLWGRGRAYRETETLRVRVDGKALPDARVEGTEWHWTKLRSCRCDAGEHVIELEREEKYDIKEGNLLTNPDFENGLEGWSFDKAVTSLDETHARSGKRCVKLSGTLTRKKLCQDIDLDVKPEWLYRLSFWVRGKFTKSGAKRYHGPHPNTLGRFAFLLEPFPYPIKWYLDGNRFDEREWQHIEVVFHTPKQEPGKPPIKRITVMPFWCPWFWGEQVGTVYIDDVSLTELGPRLRPVKMTKLLITNAADYTPKGLDGRDAYPFPPVPRITVKGLHQTGREKDAVTLSWDASRPGTRGYNVYANAGTECPTTKYFLKTSVWGKTIAAIGGLTKATTYTVKVTAINEDGVEGPAAAIRVETAP